MIQAALYDEADTPRTLLTNTLEVVLAKVAERPGWTWRLLAVKTASGGGVFVGGWSVDPPVYTLAGIPPLASLPAPDGAPR